MLNRILSFLIALVWLLNGLYCKILNMVPRHQQIVGVILGKSDAALFTKTIGVLEVAMAVWIITGYKHRLCSILQIVIVLVMNIIEFTLVPNLLLFGRINLLVAMFFALVIYLNEFVFTKTPATK